MILTPHIPVLNEILSLPAFLREPVLSFGYHDVLWHPQLREPLDRQRTCKGELNIPINLSQKIIHNLSIENHILVVPWQFMEDSFNAVLNNHGITDIHTIDYFDNRADYRHDMNLPVAPHYRNRFNTVIDIGSVEHIFDTRQCLDNLFQMVRVGGHIMFHLPCRGCFDHGFYTFSPEVIIESLRLNGFKIVFLAFTLEPEGIKLDTPMQGEDCIMWCAARKVRQEKQFVVPQQNGCKAMYGLDIKRNVLDDVSGPNKKLAPGWKGRFKRRII